MAKELADVQKGADAAALQYKDKEAS